MIIPIAAGIAATLSKALTPPASVLNMVGATDRYLIDVDRHAKEFETLLSQGSSFINSALEPSPPKEATPETPNASVKKKVRPKPPPLPKTNEPLTLLGLDALYPPETFDEIRTAYKQTVKLYHPDVILSPDATDEEKEAASQDFSRINSAFELLKKRDEAMSMSFDVYENGERVTKMNTPPSYEDPYYIDYDRLRQNAEYYSKHRERMWYEDEYHYEPNHYGGGFGRVVSQQARRERWWQENAYNDAGYHRDGVRNGYARQNDFGHGEYQTRENSYQAGARNDFSREGFPYKDRMWNERQHVFDEENFDGQYDYYPEERAGYDRFREKWWTKGHDEYESNLNGEFGP